VRQYGACMQGCPEGAKASTDVTHWPEAIAAGAQLRTGARVSRILTNSGRLPPARSTSMRKGAAQPSAADVVLLAATRSAPPGLLLNSASPRFPDGLGNSSGLVGKRLMVHPFANVLGYFDDRVDSYIGHVGAQDRQL